MTNIKFGDLKLTKLRISFIKNPPMAGFLYFIRIIYTNPCANIASATLTKPPMLAPFM